MKESNFQLIGKPKVNSMSYETNKKFNFTDELPLEISNNVQIIRCEDVHSEEAIVVLEIGIFVSKEFENVPFKISMEIEGHFRWNDILKENEKLLATMLQSNAPAILYGYLRPLITLITVEANMPPLVIPLMNFID